MRRGDRVGRRFRCARAGVFGTILGCLGLASTVAAASEPPICTWPVIGEGRVAQVRDSRTLVLDDGREIVLGGLVYTEPDQSKAAADLLAAYVHRPVTLRAADDTPDRYGRQVAWVTAEPDTRSIQETLLERGLGFASGDAAEPGCAARLRSAEAVARDDGRGVWSVPTAIKNTERPGDILARVGRFTVAAGTIVSVREAGSTTYLNFGRRWTDGFAVTISRHAAATFETAGLRLKTLAKRRVLVRGFVYRAGGPRIEALHVGQIDLIGSTGTGALATGSSSGNE